MKSRVLVLAIALIVAAAAFTAEERIDADINTRIRQEGLNNSRIMDTLQVLTDMYGARLTGSPALEAAGEWAIRRMESWGLSNGRMEPWDFGRAGWSNEYASGAITSPVKDKLEFEVIAWTPGTNGPVRGRAVNIVPPTRPTEAELLAYLASIRETVKGAMVLVGRPRTVPVDFEPSAKRRADEQVRAQYGTADPAAANSQRGGGTRRSPLQSVPVALSANEVAARIDDFLAASGATLRIDDAGRAHGQIAAFSARYYDPARTIPAVVMRNEDYGRIARILARGTPVDLQFTIVNTVHPDGKTAYNAVAEIPGSDKTDEVVMLGAHLDSWHSATGATDNAVGCAVMMEAARILKAIGVQPRRTLRLALWSGEEQGLLGSQAYVAEHFGSFENPGPGYQQLVAYVNIDGGTGRARGAGVFGPPGAARIVGEMLKPFEDFGAFGALATRSRGLGSSDHTSFNGAGLTGIAVDQDPIEYRSHTHHTNLDTYERVVEEDVKRSAIVIASMAYHLAMRDEPLPRFDAASMPPPAPRAR